MGSKCSRTITKYDLHNDEYKANPNGVDSQAAIKVQPPRVVINGAAETPIPAEEVTSEGQLSTSETKTSDLSPLSQLDVISLQSSTGTSSSKQHKTKVHFARSITMESHRSEKRVSIGSVDSCATISSASSHGSDAGSDFEADVGGSSNCPTLNLPPEEEQTSSDIPADGFELDYSSSSAMDSLSLNDTIGEMPGIRRSTPRQHQPYKSSILVRSINRSTSQDETLHWKKGNRLGRGTFGTVFLGLTKTGELIAVKQIELIETDKDEAEKEYAKIFQEVSLLKSLVHENIVKYLGSTYEHHTVSIFTEFIPGGSLATIIEKFGPLELPVTARYTRQLLSAVAYMHENHVVHRDIKSANIMLVPNGTVKLIDFGCAKRLALRLSRSGSHLQKSLRGTPYWMAPEVVNDSGHGRKSDIWSLGCTVYELLTGKPPWGDREPIAALYAIGSDDFPVPALPGSFPEDASDFVSQCLIRDKLKRPPAKQLLEHEFVKPPFFDDSSRTALKSD